ncbi:MAG: prepilin-type N-terminal cleavage/methylation domain-containing protein, partial [Planctomycetota bacterium]
MSTSERGFTLLELLIALALAAVISLCIATVSNQAQLVYDATTSKVEVYQKFRYALADMQENLQSMALTADLEFFVDNLSEPNGHWDDGEELKDSASGPNIEGGRPGKYDEGAQIIERQYTLTRGSLEEEHDNFSIYFKSAVTIEGKLRLANVEYYLADPRALDEGGSGRVARDVEDNSKFVLLKVVRYVDINESNFYTSKLKVRKVVSELCQNVTDLRIEYFYDNLFDDRPGAFITPSEEKLGQVVRSEGEIERLNDGGLLKEFPKLLLVGYRLLPVESDRSLAEPFADNVFEPYERPAADEEDFRGI